MKGIVFLGQHKLEIQEFEDPTPGPDEERQQQIDEMGYATSALCFCVQGYSRKGECGSWFSEQIVNNVLSA